MEDSSNSPADLRVRVEITRDSRAKVSGFMDYLQLIVVNGDG